MTDGIGRPLMDKTIAKRTFVRCFEDDPLGVILESVLVNMFECERGTNWFDDLLEGGALNDRDLDVMALAAISQGISRGLLDLDGDILRVPEKSIQEAMNIAGVWYGTYSVPSGEEAYCLSQKGRVLLEEYGVDGVAQILTNRIAHPPPPPEA